VETKLQKVAEQMTKELEKFARENAQRDAYHFEKGICAILKEASPEQVFLHPCFNS